MLLVSITVPMNDVLIEIEARRKKGQFYTPTELARHGWAYLEQELGLAKK